LGVRRRGERQDGTEGGCSQKNFHRNYSFYFAQFPHAFSVRMIASRR